MDPARAEVRPRTSVVGAWLDGWRRVVKAPGLVLGLAGAAAWMIEWQWSVWGTNHWAPGGVFGRNLSWIYWQQPYAFGGLGQALGNVATGQIGLSFVDGLPVGPGGPAPRVFWLGVTGGALDRLARSRPIGVVGFGT